MRARRQVPAEGKIHRQMAQGRIGQDIGNWNLPGRIRGERVAQHLEFFQIDDPAADGDVARHPLEGRRDQLGGLKGEGNGAEKRA